MGKPGNPYQLDEETDRRVTWGGAILLGVVMVVAGVGVVYGELGREERWNSLLRDYIGGPDAQAIFLGALLAVAGVVVAVYGWWRRRTPDA